MAGVTGIILLFQTFCLLRTRRLTLKRWFDWSLDHVWECVVAGITLSTAWRIAWSDHPWRTAFHEVATTALLWTLVAIIMVMITFLIALWSYYDKVRHREVEPDVQELHDEVHATFRSLSNFLHRLYNE